MMKARRFYPRQVLTRLRNRSVDSLSRGERHALDYFLWRGRLRGRDLLLMEDGVVRLIKGRGMTVLGGPMPRKSESDFSFKLAVGEPVQCFDGVVRTTLRIVGDQPVV